MSNWIDRLQSVSDPIVHGVNKLRNNLPDEQLSPQDLDEVEDREDEGSSSGNSGGNSAFSFILDEKGEKKQLSSLSDLTDYKANIALLLKRIPSRGILKKVTLKDSTVKTLTAHFSDKIVPELGAIMFDAFLGQEESIYPSKDEMSASDQRKAFIMDYLLFRFFFSHASAHSMAQESSALTPIDRLYFLSFFGEGIKGLSVVKTHAMVSEMGAGNDDSPPLQISVGSLLMGAAKKFAILYPDLGKKVMTVFSSVQTTFKHK